MRLDAVEAEPFGGEGEGPDHVEPVVPPGPATGVPVAGQGGTADNQRDHPSPTRSRGR